MIINTELNKVGYKKRAQILRACHINCRQYNSLGWARAMLCLRLRLWWRGGTFPTRSLPYCGACCASSRSWQSWAGCHPAIAERLPATSGLSPSTKIPRPYWSRSRVEPCPSCPCSKVFFVSSGYILSEWLNCCSLTGGRRWSWRPMTSWAILDSENRSGLCCSRRLWSRSEARISPGMPRNDWNVRILTLKCNYYQWPIGQMKARLFNHHCVIERRVYFCRR